jgi:hypothetical protein
VTRHGIDHPYQLSKIRGPGSRSQLDLLRSSCGCRNEIRLVSGKEAESDLERGSYDTRDRVEERRQNWVTPTSGDISTARRKEGQTSSHQDLSTVTRVEDLGIRQRVLMPLNLGP